MKQQGQKLRFRWRMQTAVEVEIKQNRARLYLVHQWLHHVLPRAFGEQPLQLLAKPMRALSFRQLMKSVTVFFHYLFSCFQLVFKVLLVRGKYQAFRPINQIQNISLSSLKFRKRFFWKNYSHRIANRGNFNFKHGGTLDVVITNVITKCSHAERSRQLGRPKALFAITHYAFGRRTGQALS